MRLRSILLLSALLPAMLPVRAYDIYAYAAGSLSPVMKVADIRRICFSKTALAVETRDWQTSQVAMSDISVVCFHPKSLPSAVAAVNAGGVAISCRDGVLSVASSRPITGLQVVAADGRCLCTMAGEQTVADIDVSDAHGSVIVVSGIVDGRPFSHKQKL